MRGWHLRHAYAEMVHVPRGAGATRAVSASFGDAGAGAPRAGRAPPRCTNPRRGSVINEMQKIIAHFFGFCRSSNVGVYIMFPRAAGRPPPPPPLAALCAPAMLAGC